MEDSKIRQLCTDMASEDVVKVNAAAREIINSVSDRDLRMEYTVLVTNYQTAKTSIEMHTAFEALIEHVKKQYSMIYAQGFVMACGYQTENFKQSLNKAIEESKKSLTPTGEPDLPSFEHDKES